MLSQAFHAWERRLAAVATDRLVRPFEWGLEWVDGTDGSATPGADLERWADRMVASSEQFFALAPDCDDYALDGEWLSYPSAIDDPARSRTTPSGRATSRTTRRPAGNAR